MQIEIDGTTRQLLLNLLAVRIAKQRDGTEEKVRNCFGKDTAEDLFQRLQPDGDPSGADVGDFVELKANGQQLELILPIDGGLLDMVPVLPPNGTPSNDDYEGSWPRFANELRWPKPITVEAAIAAPFWRVNPANECP
ncbi:hypothetical protein [Curvibacter delicatus]|jgi:hypothetical protein|uniref:hypothetical protein n=1 Tax=Curvibacter delicatus TaxID=80879 RepID=UPI001FE0D28A|nr:hypothetical protein [Curvibacter delicatus]